MSQALERPYGVIADSFFLFLLSLFVYTAYSSWRGMANCSVDFVNRILACRMTLKNLWLMMRMVRCPMGPVTRQGTQDRALAF